MIPFSRLWFDVENVKNTTAQSTSQSYRELWFDVENVKNTTHATH